MKLYNCKVRLDGQTVNEVPRFGVTAAEIMLLRHIHGGADTVVDIKETGSDQRSSEFERNRLTGLYQGVIMKTERGQMDPLMQLFGPDHLPLPNEVKMPAPAVVDVDDMAPDPEEDSLEALTA